MSYKRKTVSPGNIIIALLVSINVTILEAAFVKNEKWYWVLAVSLPLLLLAILNTRQKKTYAFRQPSYNKIPALSSESIRRETRYFIEPELDGSLSADSNNLKQQQNFQHN
jgi:hypothetical protein